MVHFLVMDVDGTLTDGKIYMGQQGELMKAFDIKDGYGIRHLLPEVGIVPVVITGRESLMVENRCRELGITELYQGRMNKYETLVEILRRYSEQDGEAYSLRDVAYVGDDVPDLQCMQPIKEAGGVVCCPPDAVGEVIAIADYVARRPAGNGAVRDCIEHLLLA